VCPKLVKAFEDSVKLAVVGGEAFVVSVRPLPQGSQLRRDSVELFVVGFEAFEGVAVAEEPGYRESEFAARSSSSRSCRLSSALIFI